LIPIGLLSIAGYLRKNGFDVKVYNASFYPKEPLQHTRKILLNYKPNIVGLGFPTDAFEPAANIAKLIKEFNKDIVIIVGGIHPTAMPNQTLQIPHFDFLIRGEGEKTTLELIKTLISKTNLSDVKGISYKRDGKVTTNEMRPEMTNLDEIPFDNRDLLIDVDKYPKDVLEQIHTSRGCPYQCAYCSSSIIWKGKVRFRSIENVLAEIEYLYYKYKVREINFADDNFTLEPERVKAICEGIVAKDFKVRWRCCARADIHHKFDMELLRLMRKAGCQNICIGFESGSQELLDRAERRIKIDEAETLTKMIKGARIKVHADFIVGLPGENESTLNKTLELMKKVWNSSRATMSVVLFKSYPGTLTYKSENMPDYRELNHKFREIFNYAENCNIKSLSVNIGFIRNRISETNFSPKELLPLLKKTVKVWTSKK
jgi:radical SAM superfamily enzyme YgiQ (UPF0313 family)